MAKIQEVAEVIQMTFGLSAEIVHLRISVLGQ